LNSNRKYKTGKIKTEKGKEKKKLTWTLPGRAAHKPAQQPSI
jgi:hypothetical protein